LGTGWGWGLNSGDEIHYRVILYCLWTGDTAPFDTWADARFSVLCLHFNAT